MKVLPKGDYVLFEAVKDAVEVTYGVLERKEFMLEKMSDRYALCNHVAIGDDKEVLERILKVFNQHGFFVGADALRSELKRGTKLMYSIAVNDTES